MHMDEILFTPTRNKKKINIHDDKNEETHSHTCKRINYMYAFEALMFAHLTSV